MVDGIFSYPPADEVYLDWIDHQCDDLVTKTSITTTSYCQQCGEERLHQGSFCHQCGTRLATTGSPQSGADRSSIAGAELLDVALEQVQQALAPGEIEDVFRASLIGGFVGARAMLQVDPKLVSLWGTGDLTKAAKLIVVWASTVAVYLLQNEPHQDSVTHDIATGLATVVFDSDEGVGLAELHAYQTQREADNRIRAEGGVALYGDTLIYYRCLRALGQPLDITAFPTPISSVSELIDMGLVEDAGPPKTILSIAPVLVESIKTAKEAFDVSVAYRVPSAPY